MKRNKGILAHEHGLKGISLLYHEYWDIDLLKSVRSELEKSVHFMQEHLSKNKCKCGDNAEDIDFYQELLDEVNRAILEKDWFVVPWVQKKLEEYIEIRNGKHNCISKLILSSHQWLLDDVISS
ncbi:hypothetical protein [Bacillus sp. Marseille-P3661]|uniref:hypothetical protein n=1 Tax=Bacillus sp. Marseille-P3661 TaxID=1936234 RepID=UPI000C85C53B|nr:hypothetical protein [Bacillus sp. Marseille-P3661]